MSRHDAIQLDESLDADEVSRAWLVWSVAAENALADAYQYCGVLSRPEVWFLDGGVLCSGLSGLEVTRCGRLEVMLLMPMMRCILISRLFCCSFA